MLSSTPIARFALICGALTVGRVSTTFAQPKQPTRPVASKNLKGWTPLSSKAGGFSALFPAPPKTMVRNQGVYKAHAFYHAVPGGAYMITYSDMRESGIPAKRIQSYNAQDILESNRQGLLIGSRGVLVSERRLNWQGAPSREVIYDIPQLKVRARSLLIFSRPFLYQVTTILPKTSANITTPTTNTFFNSFHIMTPHS